MQFWGEMCTSCAAAHQLGCRKALLFGLFWGCRSLKSSLRGASHHQRQSQPWVSVPTPTGINTSQDVESQRQGSPTAFQARTVANCPNPGTTEAVLLRTTCNFDVLNCILITQDRRCNANVVPIPILLSKVEEKPPKINISKTHGWLDRDRFLFLTSAKPVPSTGPAAPLLTCHFAQALWLLLVAQVGGDVNPYFQHAGKERKGLTLLLYFLALFSMCFRFYKAVVTIFHPSSSLRK